MQQRANDMAAKMTAQFAAGDSALPGVELADPIRLGPCSYNTGPTDSSLLNAIASPPPADPSSISLTVAQRAAGRNLVSVPKSR